MVYYTYLSIVMSNLSEFIRNQRKQYGLTQEALAERAGVGLHFVRDIEQGKKSLRMDKVNQVLELFGAELGPQKQAQQ